jgi:hypothetical protein
MKSAITNGVVNVDCWDVMSNAFAR